VLESGDEEIIERGPGGFEWSLTEVKLAKFLSQPQQTQQSQDSTTLKRSLSSQTIAIFRRDPSLTLSIPRIVRAEHSL
jgi:hypothetical protein